MGGTFVQIRDINWLFIILYGLTFFFSNAGPNTTTFILPSEAFPTEIRASCHGMSAAAGKLGAVLGATAMGPILTNVGIAAVLYICGAISLLGAILTFFCVQETMGKSLDEIAGKPAKVEPPVVLQYDSI